MTDLELARQVEPLFSAMEHESEAFNLYGGYLNRLQHRTVKMAVFTLYVLGFVFVLVSALEHLSVSYTLSVFVFISILVFSWIGAQLIFLLLQRRTLEHRRVMLDQVDRLFRVHQVGEE